MKKCIAFICTLFVLLFTACRQTPPIPSTKGEETTKGSEASPPTEIQNPIDTMEKLTDLEEVFSVTKQSFSKPIAGAVAYKMLYESANGKLAADVVLPDDYTNKSNHYPVLIYFPQIGTHIETLATGYALNGIIVIRPYARGFGESEGVRDLGGSKDLADAQRLLEIVDRTSFMKDSKIFVAGSSEGSITALRLLAEDSDKRISGCAVVDVIADLPDFANYRGEGVQNLFGSLIGKTYEEAPEEYDLRSAIKFTQKLDRPILLLHFRQTPLIPIELTDDFHDLLDDTNPNCTYYKIDALAADFQGEALQRLLSWINSHD